MLTTEYYETKNELIDLHCQINYWKAQHSKAIGREAGWKNRAQELEKIVGQNSIAIEGLTKQVEELTAQCAWLKQRVFGQKTEQNKTTEIDFDDNTDTIPCGDNKEKRRRGQQAGTNGHGRKCRTNLPSIEIIYDLEDHEKRCPLCNLPFELFPITEDSEDIHYEARVVRRVHKRKCYLPTCKCGAVKGIIMAGSPAKLIPKGMFSLDFWVHVLAEKYLFQRPMSRILKTLELEGLDVSQGTITGGLQKIKELVYPLYTRILEKNRSAKHWHMDETRWLMFVTVSGKTGYRWWLWVVVTKDTVVYIIDPFRSAQVPKNHLGENPHGIISADRYSVYKSLLNENLQIAYCWGHVRRDFIEIYDTRKKYRIWAEEWINRINEIFHLNNERLKVLSDPEQFSSKDKTLRNALSSMKQTYEKELECDNLSVIQCKTLNSLRNHWTGLLIFASRPEIPMDNNLSERNLREAALGRKNYYGCASLWSGDLTAALFTIFQTARINNLHPKQFLKRYLDACAQNKSRPPKNIDDFLPWNLSEELKHSLGHAP